jgi:hypothetical protein
MRHITKKEAKKLVEELFSDYFPRGVAEDLKGYYLRNYKDFKDVAHMKDIIFQTELEMMKLGL